MQIHPPTGATSTPPASLAPTPAVLAGRRIGILDNRKPNAGLLLARLAERLATRTGARSEERRVGKECRSRLAP